MMLTKTLKLLSNPHSFSHTKRILEEQFPELKKKRGSARITVILPGDKVLKVAYNEKGIRQNRTESDFYDYLPDYYKRYFAKVFKSCPYGHWVVQRKVNVLRQHRSYFAIVKLGNEKTIKNHLECFDISENDLCQVGKIDKRLVMFDYGLTNYDFKQLYRNTGFKW